MVCQSTLNEKVSSKDEENTVESMEVFLRLKGDNEKDYLLTVPKYTPLKDIPIFKQEILNLKNSRLVSEFQLVLKPTIFHKSTINVVNKSVHPGILIKESSSLIFDYDADETPFLKEIDMNKTAETQLWPHQLILPKWELNYFTIIIYMTIMTCWLITDLPQYINPWKNKNLTYQLDSLFLQLFRYLDIKFLVELLEQEMLDLVNPAKQPSKILSWGFFGFHVLKVAVISFMFKVGIINPPSLNPLFYYFKYFKGDDYQKKEQKKLADYMATLGLNGLKRFNIDNYKTHIYNFYLKLAGGDQVNAYKLGYFPKMKGDGIVLGKGEGFDSDLSKRFDIDTFEFLEKNGKFVLSEPYYQEIYNEMVYQMNNLNELEFMKVLREFKLFGIMKCHSEKLLNAFVNRNKIEEDKKTKKDIK